MATIGFKADDLNLHDDLDFDFSDFDFDVQEPKDDRHPVIKVIAPIGRGAREYITNSSNIERFVKAALPVGYGQAFDMARDVKNEMRQLYNSAGKEMKPVKQTAQSFMRKALPALDGKIPKGLKKKLEEFSKEEERYNPRQGNDREDQLGSLLTSIFEQKAKDEVRNRDEHNEREKMNQAFEQIRHRDTVGQLDSIRLALQSQVQYQNRVDFNVQKKQLELGYRMFWALADLNKEQKRSNAEMLTELKAARINTALPDYVKQTFHEKFKELVRNKFLENTREGMFGGAQDYVRKFTKNLGEQALGKLRTITSTADAVGGMADTAAGTLQDFGDMPGFNARDEIIAMLTQFPMDLLAEKGGRSLAKILGRNAKLRRGGSAASRFVNSATDRIQERLTSTDHNWGSLESIRELLANALPSNVPDSKMQIDRIDTLHMPSPFNRSNAKTLNEVIPGLLARIHREIKILRTGDEGTELIAYDYSKNRFSTDKKLGKDLRQRLAGNNTDRANQYANSILDKVDRGGKLTPEQREKARQTLIEKAVMGESVDVRNVWNSSHWGGGQDGVAIAERFNRYLRASDGKLSHNDQSYKRQIDLMQRHRGIVGGIGDPRVVLQQMVNMGQLDELKKLGILDDSNSINRKLYAEWLSGVNDGGSHLGQPVVPPSTTNTSSLDSRRVSRSRNGSRATSAQSGTVNLRQFINNSSTGNVSDDLVNELRSISGMVRDRNQDTSQSSVPSNVQKIVDLLTELDNKYMHASSSNHDVLVAMLERLRAIQGGVAPSSMDQGGAGPSNDPNRRSYSSLWEHFTTTAGERLQQGKGYAKRGANYLGGLWNKYSPGMKTNSKKGLDMTGGLFNDFRGKVQSYYGDVVVRGERYPRLRATLLAAGQYRDKLTGRVITSLEDITGDVVDANGNLVITMEEFYNSYVTGGVNKWVKDLFSKAKENLEDWKDRFQSWAPGAIKRVKAAGNRAFNRIKELLPPYDVYVKSDMSRPLLYANLMRYEKYFSQSTGKLIKHPRDIDGPVVDELGNVVLSEEHLKEGIVDVVGDPAGPGKGRIGIKLVRKAAAAWELMRNAAVGIFGSLSKGFGNAGQYLKDFFAPFGDMITNSRKTVTLLEQIHGLLDDRLPGGKSKVRGDLNNDGVRDGSIEDMRRQRQQTAEGVTTANGGNGRNTSGKGPDSYMGKLLSGLTSLFKKNKEEGGGHEDSLLDEAGNVAEIADFLNGDGHHGERGTVGSKARRKAAMERLKRMQGRNNPGFFRRMMNKLPGFGRGASAAAGGAAAGGSRLSRLLKWGTYNPELLLGAGGIAAAGGRPILGAGKKLLNGAGWLAGKAGRALTGQGALGRAARWGMFNTDIVRGMGKAAGWGLKGARYLPKMLGAAGTAYSGYSAYNNLKEGNYGSAAVDAGLGLGGLALTGGGLAGLAGLGGAVLGGLGAIVASPLLVPALAIGALAGAGVLLHNYFTKTRATDMSKVRLAQYGINSEDKDAVEKAFTLEAMLEKYANFKDNEVTVDTSKLDLKSIAKTFDIHDKHDLPFFNAWYNRRFLPVWKRWLAEVRRRKADGKLASVESVIPGKEKLRMTEACVNGLSEVYSYMGGWSQLTPRLSVDASGVNQVLESVRMSLAKEVERDGGATAKVEVRSGLASLTAGATDASKLAKKAKENTEQYQVRDQKGNVLDANVMSYQDLRDKIVKGEVTVDVAVNTPKELLQVDNSRLDALTTIRYKAYGLTYMTADKARTLSALEQFMADQLIGDVDHPKLTMSTDKALAISGSVFGVPNGSGEHAERWRTWFNGRFLPVFLLWAGTIRQKTGKTKLIEAHQSFPMTEQAPLARAIIGAKGKNSFGTIVPVWAVTANPWSDAYELNTDADSTAGNLEAIRQVADKVRLGEVTATNGKTHRVSKEVSDFEKGWFGSVKRTVGNWFGKDWSPHGEGAQAAGDRIVLRKDSKPLSGIGDALSFGGGGGGSYSSMPASQGDGWSANKDLVLAAASTVGVDPKGLATIIAMESGFKPRAAPSNPNLPSSAKGFGQHLDDVWAEDVERDGSKFGIPRGANQFDPRASALMTAAHMKYVGELMKKKLGRPVTLTDLYLGHLMGPGGANQFLKSPEGAIAAEAAPVAAKQHPDYFYEKGRALTVKEVYAKFAAKLSKRPAEFGVKEEDLRSTATAPPTPTASPEMVPTGDAGKTKDGKIAPLSFAPLRDPAMNVGTATKSTFSGPTVSFTPQMPKVNATVAPSAFPVASSSDLPRLNKTDTSIGSGIMSKNDMVQRDAAMSEVIAPKMDKVTNLLERGLYDGKGASFLQQILEELRSGALTGKPAPAPVQATGKAKPITTSDVPVPQRRSFN